MDVPGSGGRSRFGERAAGPLLAIVTFLVMAGVAEGVLRLAAPQQLDSQKTIRTWVLKGMYVADESAGYRLAPSLSGRIERKGHTTEFSTNSLGLRDDEPGPSEGRRILAVGDSFTFGFGVPQGDEWIHVAGRSLDGDSPVDTVNGGVNGYGTDGALATLERVGEVLEPDLVLLGFYWENDPEDNLVGAKDRYEIREGYLFDIRAHERFRENVWVRHSQLFRLIDSVVAPARERLLGEHPPPPEAKGFSQSERARAMEVSRQLILALGARAGELGARFGVVWIPEPRYLTGQLPPRELAARARLRGEVEASGIPTLDLRAAIQTIKPLRAAYLERDPHFSRRGHEAAGRVVADWIVSERLLEAPSR